MSMKVEKFEDLEVWKESMQLVVKLYKAFKDCKDFGLRDQIRRSAVSIPSNISEEFERNSNKEYIQFLYIAKGSCGELRTQLYIAIEADYLDKNSGDQYIEQAKKVSSMLFKFIEARKKFA